MIMRAMTAMTASTAITTAITLPVVGSAFGVPAVSAGTEVSAVRAVACPGATAEALDEEFPTAPADSPRQGRRIRNAARAAVHFRRPFFMIQKSFPKIFQRRKLT